MEKVTARVRAEIEDLGQLATSCELWAMTPGLTEDEQAELKALSDGYRREQFEVLGALPHHGHPHANVLIVEHRLSMRTIYRAVLIAAGIIAALVYVITRN